MAGIKKKSIDRIRNDKDKKYVRDGGNVCPYCGLYGVESTESVQVDGGIATQSIGCPNCKKEWTDIYHLIGYQESV